VQPPPRFIDTIDSLSRPERIDIPVSRRLERMRGLSRLLDTAFKLPGGFRIGIDPIIGLIPGIGDFLASSLSIWFLYDACRLGIKKRILAIMLINVMMEAAVGAIPVLGNVADAFWKANTRNMALVERHYSPALNERSMGKLIAFLIGSLILIYGSIAFVLYLLFSWITAMYGSLFQF
jgi:hypothetical protein